MNRAYIYKVTNLINNKIYIGFTTNIKQRHFDHFKHNRSKPKYLLGKAVQKHGSDTFTFEVLYESADKDYTKSIMEPLYIACYNSHFQSGHGYNMTYGGDGVTHTADSCKKIGEAARKRLAIKNNGAETSKKFYLITYDNASTEVILGLAKFTRDNDYSLTAIKLLVKKERRYHKNIISIDRL